MIDEIEEDEDAIFDAFIAQYDIKQDEIMKKETEVITYPTIIKPTGYKRN